DPRGRPAGHDRDRLALARPRPVPPPPEPSPMVLARGTGAGPDIGLWPRPSSDDGRAACWRPVSTRLGLAGTHRIGRRRRAMAGAGGGGGAVVHGFPRHLDPPLSDLALEPR